MLSGDLGLVAETAMGQGAEGLEAIGLELGRPMRPMLASTAGDVAEAIDALGRASVEWKLDGARIQVHRRGDSVDIWTRNLNEITGRLPGIAAVVRSFPADELVLDGEVLGFFEDDDDEAPQAFQDTMSSLGASTRQATGLRPFFFDVLHHDGVDLVDQPLVERRARLETVCGDDAVPGTITDDAATAQDVLDTALAAGHEGVLVKAADSTYEAGRRGKTWRKVKPVHTLDLVVLGAEWGHGRRQGWLSNLHLGARGPGGTFVMVGKTFKGLTDELLAWQTQAFLAREVRREGITVHIRPEIVVEIALDGVQRSSRYPGGVALRFARVKGYRLDKPVSEADTIETVQAML
jgi:DNA ligase-1